LEFANKLLTPVFSKFILCPLWKQIVNEVKIIWWYNGLLRILKILYYQQEMSHQTEGMTAFLVLSSQPNTTQAVFHQEKTPSSQKCLYKINHWQIMINLCCHRQRIITLKTKHIYYTDE